MSEGQDGFHITAVELPLHGSEHQFQQRIPFHQRAVHIRGRLFLHLTEHIAQLFVAGSHFPEYAVCEYVLDRLVPIAAAAIPDAPVNLERDKGLHQRMELGRLQRIAHSHIDIPERRIK